MVNLEKFREFDPDVETIISTNSGDLIVIDRYGPDDFSAWWTDEENLYNPSYGCSIRGTLEDILIELKDAE